MSQILRFESNINKQKLECLKMFVYFGNGGIAEDYAAESQTKYDF